MNTKSEISNQKRVADIRPQNLHWGGCFIGKSARLHSQPIRLRPTRRAIFRQYWKLAVNLKQLWALWEQNSKGGSVAPRKKLKSRQRRRFGSILGFWRRRVTFRLQRRLEGRKTVAASTTKSAKRFTLMLHGQLRQIIDRHGDYERSDRKNELSESWSDSEMSRRCSNRIACRSQKPLKHIETLQSWIVTPSSFTVNSSHLMPRVDREIPVLV